MQRVLQTTTRWWMELCRRSVEVGGGPINHGVRAPGPGASSNTPATVLYDGSVVSSPASWGFVAVNSIELIGSMGPLQSDPDRFGVGGEHIAKRGEDDPAGRSRRRRRRLHGICYWKDCIPRRACADRRGTRNCDRIAGIDGRWRGLKTQRAWRRRRRAEFRGLRNGRVGCRSRRRGVLLIASAALAVLSFSASRAAAIAGTYGRRTHRCVAGATCSR